MDTAPAVLAAATHYPDWIVFVVAAAAILVGAFGVILYRNPVHSALSLVLTLFGVAVEFVNQQADFLAAVQVIVYAGAIVILFLFVIMLLGVDRSESLAKDPLKGQRPVAIILGVVILVELASIARLDNWATGCPLRRRTHLGAGRQHRQAGPVDLHPLPVSLRDHLRPARHRRGRRRVLARRPQRVASELTREEQEAIGR